jgi:hypothetical protein
MAAEVLEKQELHLFLAGKHNYIRFDRKTKLIIRTYKKKKKLV